MTERRRTEALLADAGERLRLTERLPEQLADVRGWARNAEQNVTVTVDVHGALAELHLEESALAAGASALGEEITRLAANATCAALREGVNTLGDALGDAGALEMMHSAGLSDLVDPDAEVIPYVPGVDPNAHTWNVIPPDR
ncbi:MAG: hypothetical protein ACRDQ5_16610 [Sciscionella sp.]